MTIGIPKSKWVRVGSRRGATMVEFALVVPIVFILFFAAVEFSRVLIVRHTVDNAVYEAARVAIVPGATVADVQTEAARVLSTLGVVMPTIVVTPDPITRTTPQVSVRITVPVAANSYVPPQYFARSVITRELTLRREGVPQ